MQCGVRRAVTLVKTTTANTQITIEHGIDNA